MRSFTTFGFLALLAVANVAHAQTQEQIQRPSMAFTVNTSTLADGAYVVDFNSPVFEHDDVASCRDFKVASQFVKEVCDSFGVDAAEFTRYSVTIHAAKMLKEGAVYNLLETIRRVKNTDLQKIDFSNVEIQLPPMPPVGCSSTEGFSIATGQSCTPMPAVQVWSAFPEGCTSREGYSKLTGRSCTPRLFPTKQ